MATMVWGAQFGAFAGAQTGELRIASSKGNNYMRHRAQYVNGLDTIMLEVKGGELAVGDNNPSKFNYNIYHGPWVIKAIPSLEILASGNSCTIRLDKK